MESYIDKRSSVDSDLILALGKIGKVAYIYELYQKTKDRVFINSLGDLAKEGNMEARNILRTMLQGEVLSSDEGQRLALETLSDISAPEDYELFKKVVLSSIDPLKKVPLYIAMMKINHQETKTYLEGLVQSDQLPLEAIPAWLMIEGLNQDAVKKNFNLFFDGFSLKDYFRMLFFNSLPEYRQSIVDELMPRINVLNDKYFYIGSLISAEINDVQNVSDMLRKSINDFIDNNTEISSTFIKLVKSSSEFLGYKTDMDLLIKIIQKDEKYFDKKRSFFAINDFVP